MVTETTEYPYVCAVARGGVVVFGLRAPGVGRRPGAHARRFLSESRYSLLAQSSTKSTASCRPHCGSAPAPPRFARQSDSAVARWNFISILLAAKRMKFLFKRGVRRASLVPACQSGIVRALAEILLEQFTIVLTISYSSSRARWFEGTALAPGGRCVPHSQLAASAQFFVRAPWEILSKRASTF